MKTVSFEEINGRIQAFLQDQNFDAYNLNDEKFKLPFSDALFCAEDTVRNRAFFEGIRKAMQDLQKLDKEPVVVDAGSGTGILGVFALFLGAEKCFFLEHNPYSLHCSKKLIEHFQLSEKCTFIQCDATTFELPESYDLLICETISSGFVTEDFPPIINNLKNFGSKNSIIIPEKFDIQIIERNRKQEQLSEQSLSVISEQGFSTIEIRLNHPETKYISFRSRGFLYENVFLDSGDTPSFLNEQKIELEKKNHPLFRFLPFGKK